MRKEIKTKTTQSDKPLTFAHQREYDEFMEGEYSGLVETDAEGTDYMSPLMSPTTQESQLTVSPVEDRVVSPCSELDLDTSGITNQYSVFIRGWR